MYAHTGKHTRDRNGKKTKRREEIKSFILHSTGSNTCLGHHYTEGAKGKGRERERVIEEGERKVGRQGGVGRVGKESTRKGK